MAGDSELAQRFLTRFAGLERAHGRYWPKPVDQKSISQSHSGTGQKNEGAAKTVFEPATAELWEKHLAGSYSLGIVPIRMNDMVVFGAIDVDRYDKDLAAFAKLLTDSDLPLIPCRTKSGGVHLYLFLDEPVPAELARTKLMEWAIALGHSGVEVYPKQARLAGPNDNGSWINMPYFEGDAGVRYAIGPDGERLTAEQFLDLADALAINQGLLEVINPPQIQALGERWEGAPPCLQTLAINGFGEGGRNKALFNIGVYLRKRYDDEYKDHLDGYNSDFMTPPLGHKEVAQIEKNVGKKVYQYMCGEPPIAGVCNRQVCLTRKYGIGRHNDEDPGVSFGPLVKIDIRPDPIWIWDVDGHRIELETQELKDQGRFHIRVMNELNKWPRMVKPGIWADLVREKLKSVEIVEVPPDATPHGQVWSKLEEFIRGRPPARSKEELPMGKPWTDGGRTYFHGPTFLTFLQQQRVSVKEKQVWNILRKNGADAKFWNIGGRGVNTWHVPAFPSMNGKSEMPIPGLDDEM